MSMSFCYSQLIIIKGLLFKKDTVHLNIVKFINVKEMPDWGYSLPFLIGPAYFLIMLSSEGLGRGLERDECIR